MQALIEQSAQCPYCAEPITLLVDTTQGDQDYIEDCEVCCQPMRVCLDLSAEINLRLLRDS